LADDHECIDIADQHLTLRAAERRRIDGIICDTTDVGVHTMAYVAERLGLPGIGIEASLNFTNKYRMRYLTSRAGLPTPPFFLVRTLSEALRGLNDIGLPAVIKPVDSQSSRGVHVIRSRDQLASFAEDALRCSYSRQAIVEGFLDGTEVTVESFCCDGRVYVAGISDKDHFAHRPEVADRLTYPAALPEEVFERIRVTNERVVRTLGLNTGIAHGEYMVVGGNVFLLEIAARGAGSRVYSHIVPYLAGTSVPEAYLKFVTTGKMSIRPDGKSRAANLGFFHFPSGIVRKIVGLESARRMIGVQEIMLEFSVGNSLSPPDDDRSRPGFVVVFGESRDEVLRITDRVYDTVQVETS
jgi:biotin carboxylase